MKKNFYYEYRSWTFFWGLFLDQKKEIRKAIDKYNAEGWTVAQFQMHSTKVTVFMWIIIFLISALTLGFISYWVGFSIIFERDESEIYKKPKSTLTNEEKARLFDESMNK
ncbi:hypothetical protein LVD15_16475 [Fulvivirga maritima]|uniref:hypothetical protein n=1 Tax=Fulvivirga maritima TaxID=2904247 RepID=UPI001F46DD70|nr:hypothetical protein [Fulvivirga maritima]UII24895.1 hypothetical protein LVD15_16475 [Fulvivirga maritima]